MKEMHCVKIVYIRSFSGPNTGQCGPEKLRIRTLFCNYALALPHSLLFPSLTPFPQGKVITSENLFCINLRQI